jgi:PAS domain S-box-containing protein
VLPICEQEFLADLKREGYTCKMLNLPNRIQRLALFVLFCATWFNAGVGTAAGLAPAPVQRVLVLYSDERLLPANIIMDEAIRAAFAAGTKNRVEFYSEFLDVARFPGEEQQQRRRDFFRDKYRERPPDLVIAVSGGAWVFLSKHRAELFAGVPIVYCSLAGDAHADQLSDARIVQVTVPDCVAPTLEMMLRLDPDTRQVAVVSGSGPRDRQMADVFRQEMTAFGNRVAFTWLTNLSMEELRGELSRLADHTVVLYLTMFQDAAGKTFTPRQALDTFAPASRAPIYSCYDTYVGHGILGGWMVTFEEIGRKAAQLGIRILAGEDAQAAARSESHQAMPMVDWHQLRRWTISEQRLPLGSIIRFKEATYWEQHYRIIVTALFLCLLEALLIVALLAQLRRRRLAEAALRDSEERMSLAAEAARLGMWVWDVVRDEVWTTDKGRALLGLAPDTRLDSAALIARVHPEDRAARAAAIRHALETRGAYAMEYRVLLPDGALRWIGARGHCINAGDPKGIRFLGVSMDVTAQKQAQDALRESEARFRTMADTAPVMIWMSGTDKLCTFFNKGWLEFTGRSLEQELGNGWAEGVHREDFDCCFKVYVNSFDARQPFTMEYRLRRSDGEYRWILDNGSPRFAPEGTFLGYIGSCIDITERKQAQDRLQLVVEASPNGIVLVNAQGHIVLVNARAEKLFGYRREELIGQGIELLVPERFRGEHTAHRARFYAAPAGGATGAGLELFARRKDGTEFPVEIGSSPIQSPEGTLVLSVIVDITTRKQAEAEARQHREELAHLSRVAIMGEMAGSLAHELNQPLTGIVNNASAGRRFIAKGRADLPKLDSLFEAIVADGRRAGEIIRGIRGMVRKGEEVRGPVNLNGVIASVLRFVRSDALGRHCALVTEPDPKLPLVEADPVRLQQVLLNLVVNAFEAMRETPVAERRMIIRSERESERRVRVSVRDFGTGLPVEEPERIFERFFSTKREGLGMGLAIARSIIASHGGELAAANAQGGGACVHFSLPVIAEGYGGSRKFAHSGGG